MGSTVTSENYFGEIRRKSEVIREREKSRVDWRKDLAEAAKEKPQNEGDHPYVRVMPHASRIPQKKKEEKMQEVQSEGLSPREEHEKVLRDMAISLAAKKMPKKKAKPQSRQRKTIPMDIAAGYGQNKYQGD